MNDHPAPLAVIIVTKNRAEAIERYALASLTRQDFRDFICVVWDASDNDSTQKVTESRDWGFPIYYFHAPRMGSSSQRNDAAKYVWTEYLSVCFVLFIDDDSELSPDAISGVIKTFETTTADLVNIPMRPWPGKHIRVVREILLRLSGKSCHGVSASLKNIQTYSEPGGVDIEWAASCGMALKIDIFRDEEHYFPEPFQRFGSYAFAEDFAFSYYLHERRGRRIINSVTGYLFHYGAPGGRLDKSEEVAARLYNHQLLYEALYNDRHGLRKAWVTLNFRCRRFLRDYLELIHPKRRHRKQALAGIRLYRAAIKEFHQKSDVSKLFQYGVEKGWEN